MFRTPRASAVRLEERGHANGARQTGRLALSVRVTGTTEARVALAGAVPYDHPATRTLTYSATYGRPFASFITGKEGRIDLSVAYDGKPAWPT